MPEVADAARRQIYDGAGKLCTHNGQAKLFQRRGEGGATTQGPSDDPVGAPQERSAVELQVSTVKDKLSDKSTDGATTSRGVGRFCDAQRGGRQDDAANSGASILDLL